jgi:purine-nucleoside phosphorylase
MKTIKEQLNETVPFIKSQISTSPTIGIVLGTGLNALGQAIETNVAIEYADIPNFSISTVETHTGRLLFGTFAEKNVVAMQGRFHYYEGYSMQEVTFPIRVMKELGVKILIISNAAGTLNPFFKKGSLMVIDDYINLMGTTPLVGEYDKSYGHRFQEMSEPYSQRLISRIEDIATNNNIHIYKGVYAAMTGPCLETRAEYHFLRNIGADAIGMSTIPETIVAKQVGLETLAISILTDECFSDVLAPVTFQEIVDVASNAEPKLTKIVTELILNL